jgi:hypothetical protein
VEKAELISTALALSRRDSVGVEGVADDIADEPPMPLLRPAEYVLYVVEQRCGRYIRTLELVSKRAI